MSLENIHFILVRPQMGENIGFVARAIKNFNIKHLRIVNPRCYWPNHKASATSVGAKDILKKGCPLNFNEFENNNCAGTVFHGINIVVDFVGNNPDTFNLLTLRSFGESFYHHITDAALEFGYVGV